MCSSDLLVGAGDGFVRLPLVLEGVLEAVLAAALALGLLYAGTAWLDGRPAEVVPLPLSWALGFLGFSALLGLIGSLLALVPVTRRH